MNIRRFGLALAGSLLSLSTARAEQTLRIAMTAADIAFSRFRRLGKPATSWKP